MADEVNKWLEEWNGSKRKLKTLWISAHFPMIVDVAKITSSGCSSTIIAAGQWSAGKIPEGSSYNT